MTAPSTTRKHHPGTVASQTLRSTQLVRARRIAALRYTQKHAVDRDDFLQLADVLGLDDLLVRA